MIPAYNPEGGETDVLNLERPDHVTWRKLTLISPKRDGSISEITLLRPLWWLEEQQAEIAGEVWVEVPECGISGWAKLLSIEPCPTIENKDGHVVTGTFKHSATNVLDIWIDGESQPIGTTPNHLFWSEDTQTFVRVDELTIGTTLRLIDNACIEISHHIDSCEYTDEPYYLIQDTKANVKIYVGTVNVAENCKPIYTATQIF